jgi:multidrug resistance efflux pump
VKRPLFVSLSVLILIGLATLGVALAWPRPQLDATPTSPAQPRARLVCYGYVDHRRGPVLLQPARAGRVTQVFAKENQAVSKGAPLVQLDDRQVRLQEEEATLAVQAAQLQHTKAKDGVQKYQARRAQAEAALEAATSKVRAAEHALAHKEELVNKGLVNRVEADVGRAQLSEARALVKAEQNRLAELKAVDPELEVKLAQLQLDRSQTQLERARQEREEYLLRAPAGGLVLRVQVQDGDLVGPTSLRPAVWLALEGAWIVRAEVSQEFAGQVGAGQAALVEDEASAATLGQGTIAEVSEWFLPRRQLSALPTGINTGLTLECVIDLQEGHAPLRLGQRVRIRILADQKASEST